MEGVVVVYLLKFVFLLISALMLTFCSWSGYGQDIGHRPLDLRIPPDILRGETRPVERRPIQHTPEVNLYSSQLTDKMLATINGSIKSNRQLCGEMNITLLINADGSVNDVQFPGKALGDHSDPSGMLETRIRQALFEANNFPPAPVALQIDPKYKNFVLNGRFRRPCSIGHAR